MNDSLYIFRCIAVIVDNNRNHYIETPHLPGEGSLSINNVSVKGGRGGGERHGYSKIL